MNNNKTSPKMAFTSSVLSRFLLISLPLLIIVFVLAIASYQWSNHHNEHKELQKKLDGLIATYSLILSKPLAEDNVDELDLYTIALLSDSDISEVKIIGRDNTVLQSSGTDDLINPSVYKQSIDITYIDELELKTVGKLTLGVTDKQISEHLNQMYVDSLILLIALLIVASFGIFIAYKKSVGHPLSLLVNAISFYRENRQHTAVIYNSKNEFGEVIDAYNQMQDHEIELHIEIKQYQTELEREIQETKALQVQLVHEASHDSLTNLYNRRTFDRRLVEALNTAKSKNLHGAIISMDLDRFKIVNDTCGHIAGDKLLQELSATMSKQVADKGILARLGGDEFAIITEDTSLTDSLELAENIRLLIQDFGFSWQGKYFEVGISMGLVPYNQNSTDIHHLMRTADSACYEAKEQGRNRIQVYQENDSKLANKFYESEMITILNESLKKNRFELWFQDLVPITCTDTPKQHSFEILIRMRDEQQNLVSPGAFLPAAERFGLATKIDSWVVQNVFSFLNNNLAIIDKTALCLINLSGLSVGDETFLKQIIETQNSVQFPASKICFEITETAAIINMPKAKKFIYTLQELGFKFALDDFGSGMSSFEYLKNLPVDILKIDGSFIREITKNSKDASIVEAMVQVGKVMGKKVVAEFVEDEATYKKLQEMRVDYAQGYHLSRPSSLEQLIQD